MHHPISPDFLNSPHLSPLFNQPDIEVPHPSACTCSLLSKDLIQRIFSYLDDARDRTSFSLVNKSFHSIALESEQIRLQNVFKTILRHLYHGLGCSKKIEAIMANINFQNTATLSGLYRAVWQKQNHIAQSTQPLTQQQNTLIHSNFIRLYGLNLPSPIRHFLSALFWKVQLANTPEQTSADFLLLLFRSHSFYPLLLHLRQNPNHIFIQTLSCLPGQLPLCVFPNSPYCAFQDHEAMLWVRFTRSFFHELPEDQASQYLQLLNKSIPRRINALLFTAKTASQRKAKKFLSTAIEWMGFIPNGDVKQNLRVSIAHQLLRQGLIELLWHFLDYKLDGDLAENDVIIGQCIVAMAFKFPSRPHQELLEIRSYRLANSKMKDQVQIFLKVCHNTAIDIEECAILPPTPSPFPEHLQGHVTAILDFIYTSTRTWSIYDIELLQTMARLLHKIRPTILSLPDHERTKLYEAMVRFFPDYPNPEMASICWSILAHQILQETYFDLKLWQLCLDHLAIPRDEDLLSHLEITRLWNFCYSLLTALPMASNAIWRQFLEQLSMLIRDPAQHATFRHHLLPKISHFILLPECAFLLPDDLLFPM